VHKGKSKTGDETPIRTERGEKISLVPFFCPLNCFHLDFSIHLSFSGTRSPVGKFGMVLYGWSDLAPMIALVSFGMNSSSS